MSKKNLGSFSDVRTDISVIYKWMDAHAACLVVQSHKIILSKLSYFME